MIDPTEKDIGRKVIYAREDPFRDTEYGVVTSFNDRVVFVRYGSRCASAPTDRADLEWDA